MLKCTCGLRLTLTFVSKDPEATNSPYGWKSMPLMLLLWPVRVLTTEMGEILHCNSKL